jgi:hypothetical protein
VTTPDIGAIITQLVQGVQHIGNATSMIVQWIFSLAGVNLPDMYARVIVLLISGYTLYKYGSKLADIVVILVLLLIAATVMGFNFSAFTLPKLP